MTAETFPTHFSWRGFFQFPTRIKLGSAFLSSLKDAIASKRVAYDFARLMDSATEFTCSAFGDNIIANM